MPAAEHQMAQEPIKQFTDELEVELAKHPGKWVAIDDHDRLLAVGDSAHEVREAARRQGLQEPLVMWTGSPGEILIV